MFWRYIIIALYEVTMIIYTIIRIIFEDISIRNLLFIYLFVYLIWFLGGISFGCDINACL